MALGWQYLAHSPQSEHPPQLRQRFASSIASSAVRPPQRGLTISGGISRSSLFETGRVLLIGEIWLPSHSLSLKRSSPRRYRSMEMAAFLPWAIESIIVPGPVTKSPPPQTHFKPFSRGIGSDAP